MRLSSAASKSVIVLLEPSRTRRVSATMEAAQRAALKSKLPMAVVVPYDSPSQPDDGFFKDMALLELQLSHVQVPLILMFGSKAAVLKSLQKHFEPDVYQSDDRPGVLTRHQFAWPWPVQSVAVLQRYLAKVGIEGVCAL